jgi:uncharacterized damage-inducible protein DinB
MHTTLAEIVETIEADRAALVAAGRELTQEQLDFRPAEDRWSVSENLDHLAKVEKGIARLLAMKIAEARASGKPAAIAGPSQLRTLDRFDIPNNSRKIKVPDEKVAPHHGVAKAELFGNLEASRRSLRESLDQLADYDLSSHTFPHPLFGEINLYQWVLFVGQHERRHLNQIKSVLADSRFPAAPLGVVNS